MSLLGQIRDKHFFYIKQPEIIDFLSTFLDRKEFKPGEPNAKEDIERAMYFACTSLDFLESMFYPDLNKWLVDNGYYDKDVYKKYNSKVRGCNTETYQAAKKWLALNKNTFKPFDREKFY